MAIRRVKYIKKDGNYLTGIITSVGGRELVAGYFGEPKDGKFVGFIKALNGTVSIDLTAVNMHQIKLKIKKALVELGVAFDVETRKFDKDALMAKNQKISKSKIKTAFDKR